MEIIAHLRATSQRVHRSLDLTILGDKGDTQFAIKLDIVCLPHFGMSDRRAEARTAMGAHWVRTPPAP